LTFKAKSLIHEANVGYRENYKPEKLELASQTNTKLFFRILFYVRSQRLKSIGFLKVKTK